MQNLINTSFVFCVKILRILASMMGITYEAINIYFFCIIEPIVFCIMLYVIVKQFYKIKTLNLLK